MVDFLEDYFLWIKAVHIMAVISWMAAMLYLPRLFVYHAGVAPDGPESALFKVMERRLSKGIMTPAMIATWVLGLVMIATPGVIDWASDIWFHIKFTLVIALSGLHGYLVGCVRAFAEDRNRRRAGFYRIVNEVPAIIMAAVVILVVVRPF